jgi:DNA-binding SARP family transcriptional activator
MASGARIRLHLLGQFQLVVDGSAIEITSRRVRLLLALLALHRGRQLLRDKVAGLLWPESSDKNAKISLRQTLWQLRNALSESGIDPDDLLAVGRSELGIPAEAGLWVDAGALEEDLGEMSSWEERIRQVRLYAGELLPGIYDEWVSPHRTRLAARFDHIAEGLLADLIDAGRWPDALEVAQRYLEIAGPSETAYRAAINAQSEMGNAAAAMEIYQECVEVLESHFGLNPSRETDALVERLRRGERQASPSTRPLPDLRTEAAERDVLESLHDEPPVFVARKSALAKLNESLERALAGEGTVHFVAGDSGRGKTALVMQFIREAQGRHDSLVAAAGSCEASIGMGDPFAPFREIMTLLVGDLRSNLGRGAVSRQNGRRLLEARPDNQAVLLRYGPDMAPRFLRGTDIAATDDVLGTTTYLDSVVGQAARCLLAIAEARPLIVFVDDLQWADRGTMALFFQLGRRAANSPIILIGAYRPEEIGALHDGARDALQHVVMELVRLHGASLLDLDALGTDEERIFMEEFLDSEPNLLGKDFRKALFNQTSGHPLFTIELLRSMEAEGTLVKDEEERWIPGQPLKWGDLPPRVEAAIGGRILRLSLSDQELLSVAAVEGERFTAEVIGMVRERSLNSVISKLSGPLQRVHRLVEAEGVKRTKDGQLSRYRFRHHLIQEYLYNQIDPVELVHLHEGVSQALEALHQNQREEVVVRLTRHYRKAGKPEAAVRAHLEAGRLSSSLAVHQEAIDHFERALELLKTDPQLRKDSSLEGQAGWIESGGLCGPLGYVELLQRSRKASPGTESGRLNA